MHTYQLVTSTFFPGVDFPDGSALSLKLYVRNACNGSGQNLATARLWNNDSFGASIGADSNDYYLKDSSLLATTAGSGPMKTIDSKSGAKRSSFKPFGTWTITLCRESVRLQFTLLG